MWTVEASTETEPRWHTAWRGAEYRSRKAAESDMNHARSRNPLTKYRITEAAGADLSAASVKQPRTGRVLEKATTDNAESSGNGRVGNAIAEKDRDSVTSFKALPSKTNWRGTVFIVRRGEGDYLDRFTEQYPEVGWQIERICTNAGTYDADHKILQAAGGLIADLEAWAIRARDAMRDRRHIKFDVLCYELADIIGPATPSL